MVVLAGKDGGDVGDSVGEFDVFARPAVVICCYM